MKPPKKKILFLAQLPPPVHGASIMNSHVFNSQLIRSKFEFIPLPLQFADSIADIGRISFKKIWLMVVYCFKLIYTILKFRPDVAYFTIAPIGGAFYRDAVFSIILRVFNVKRLYHLHGKGIQQEIDHSAFKRRIYRLVFQKSNVIILAGTLHKDIEAIYSGRPYILPCGVPEDPFYNTPRKTRTEPVFLFLSNLVQSKGIDIFLECINQLNKRGFKFKAYIVGAPFDVSLEHVQQYIEQNGLSNCSKILGPLYGDAKKEILMESDILVFPTYYKNEAFPVTILEAMQAAMPVIASNNGGIPEMIDQGKTGFVTPAKDKKAVLEKMELLINEPELRTLLGKNAKYRFHQHYTIEIFEQTLLNILKEVTDKK